MNTAPLTDKEIRAAPVGTVIGTKHPTAYAVALRVADMGECWTITGLDKTFSTEYIIGVSVLGYTWHLIGAYENEE